MSTKNDLLRAERPLIFERAVSILGLKDALLLKPQGCYYVRPDGDRVMIEIRRPGLPPEFISCLSPGHANRVRMKLNDMGLAGQIEGAL